MKYLESIQFSSRPGKAKSDSVEKDSYTGYLSAGAVGYLLISTVVPVDIVIWPIAYIPM